MDFVYNIVIDEKNIPYIIGICIVRKILEKQI